MSADPHRFAERLAYSERAGDEPFWEAAYQAAFPDFAGMMGNAHDNAAQRLGIDRIVLLNSGKQLTVDEKKRAHDYGDILLEYVSNDQSRAPGWIAKDLPIDFLAYAVMPRRQVYFFSWPLLHAAWVRHGAEWIAKATAREVGYRLVSAQNVGYQTLSVAVPLQNVMLAVHQAAVVVVPAPRVA